MSLKDSVMVVNLSISQWTARKYDAAVSNEVAESKEANYDAGRYNKALINSPVFKKIGKVSGAARTFHYFNTLPWGDNGDRVLPVGNYFDYLNSMNNMKLEFNRAVQDFLYEYSRIKDESQIRLGKMFNEADFPTAGELEGKFAFGFRFYPVAEAADFRVNVGTEEVARIRADVHAEMQNRVKDAIGDLIDRVKKAVSHMAEALSDNDAIFRDSLVTNVCNLIDLLPKLNFTDDAKITALVNQIRPLCGDVNKLRTDPKYRKMMANKATETLALL